jgi:uncharacterized protein (TIGR00369 family)
METRSKRSRVVTWEDPLQALEAAAGKTGLELLKEFENGKREPPPIAKTMGFIGTHFEEGRAVFEGDPAEYLYNPIGTVHGGFAMALLDSAMGCAVHSTLGIGERYTTLEVKTNFVRPITLDTGRVRCEGAVIHRGSTVATGEGRITAIESGKLLAHGTTTCLIIPARSA